MADGFIWKRRHTVLTVLFLTWIVSFVDRISISVAIPYIAEDYGLSPVAMGIVLGAFFGGYSLTQIPGGILADRFGVRRVVPVAMIAWSFFTALTGAAGNLTQLLSARFMFGLSEGMFPACAFKSISVWFPLKERARANAVMLASNSLGAAIAPLVAVAFIATLGWRGLFYALAIPGVALAAVFWMVVREEPSDSKEVGGRSTSIDSRNDAPGPSSPKRNMLSAIVEPHVFTYFLVLFTFDIAYWGFATWLPTYLVKARGFSMVEMGVIASLPFIAGTIGGVVGGWLTDRYFEKARKLPIFAAQLIAAVLLYLTFSSTSTTALIVWQTLAGFFIKFFFGVFWALPMNTVPERLMGVASGFINMGGQLAAFISPILIGFLVQEAGGGFGPTFALLIGSLLVSFAITTTLPNRIAFTDDNGKPD